MLVDNDRSKTGKQSHDSVEVKMVSLGGLTFGAFQTS